MKPYAKNFYRSRKWYACRKAYLQKVGGLCERCLKEGVAEPAVIVHHKIYINEDNIHDPSVTLNFDNLEALCMRHHNEEHFGTNVKRYRVDEFGRVHIKI